MTTPSHTELAAQAAARLKAELAGMYPRENIDLSDVRTVIAALESPERVQGELGFYIEERAGVQVLQWHSGGCRPAEETEVAMWNQLKATPPTAPPQDPQGEAYKLSDEDINEGAERHGITVAGPRLEDFDAGVRWAELVLANPPDADTPSPQAEKQPLSEADEALMRQTLAQMEDLHRFYTHIWDRVDGCATIMAASIPAFEDSVEKHTDGINALRKRLETPNAS